MFPSLRMVPYSATSTWAVRSTQSIFSARIDASVTGRGTSYGMSTQVVTPPAAAERVEPSMPGQPMDEEVCMWPSTRPGKMNDPEWSCRWSAGGGAPCPTAAIRSPRDATKPLRSTPAGVTTWPWNTWSNGCMRGALLVGAEPREGGAARQTG